MTSSNPVSSSPTDIRRAIKRERSLLSSSAQRGASLAVAAQLQKHPWFRKAGHIGAYLPVRGELSPLPLLEIARGLHKHCHLPCLHPFHPNRLWFRPWHVGTRLLPNRFGIDEPPHIGAPLSLRRLDLLLVPLVAFDEQCHRLGMGGGFYDRTLAPLQRPRGWHKPRLIGLGYELQRVDKLQPQPWDVDLDAVCSEAGLYLPADQ